MIYQAENTTHLPHYRTDLLSEKSRELFSKYVDQLTKDLRELVEDLTEDNWQVMVAYTRDLELLTARYRAIADAETSPANEGGAYEADERMELATAQPSFTD